MDHAHPQVCPQFSSRLCNIWTKDCNIKNYSFIWKKKYIGSESLQVFYHLLISAFPLEKEVIGISLTNLTLPPFCACAKPGSGCPMLYLVVMLMFNELRWEVIVCFVDIGGIVEVRGDCLFCWYWWNCWGERWLFVLLILVELLRWEVIVHFVDIGGIVEVRDDCLICWY